MIKTILFWMLGLLIAAFVIVWLWTGGISKAKEAAKIPTNIINLIFFNGTSTGQTLTLPWQFGPAMIPTVEDPNKGTGVPMDVAQYSPAPGEGSAQTDVAKNFGNPSPFRGMVIIAQAYGAQASDPREEYVVIGASSANTAPIDVTGWSLQSAYTGARGYIPQSDPLFAMGNVPNPGATVLNPGAIAIVNSGSSPVGTSFRENICSGYLSQFQEYYPSLSNSCPSPSSQLPLNAESLRAYGDTCFDFLQTIPTCTSPFQNLPPSLPQSCRTFAVNTLSYNGCVARNVSEPGFAIDSWRIYLSSGTELWRNSHDIVRLMDNLGRTVDVLTY